jgi:hypothetical protein
MMKIIGKRRTPESRTFQISNSKFQTANYSIPTYFTPTIPPQKPTLYYSKKKHPLHLFFGYSEPKNAPPLIYAGKKIAVIF